MPASIHYGLVADRPNSTRPQPRLPWTRRSSWSAAPGSGQSPLPDGDTSPRPPL